MYSGLLYGFDTIMATTPRARAHFTDRSSAHAFPRRWIQPSRLRLEYTRCRLWRVEGKGGGRVQLEAF